MKINRRHHRIIRWVLARLLKAALPSQQAIVVLYDLPCPEHNVYNIYLSPPRGMGFQLNMVGAFEQMVTWNDKYDDDSTYVHRVMVDEACTHIYYCFKEVKCGIHIFHSSDYVNVMEGARVFIYCEGELTEPERGTLGPPPQEVAEAEYMTGLDKEVEVVHAVAQQPAGLSPEALAKVHPKHVSTVLFLLITLLGGKATVRQMDNLTNNDKGAAFRYLRTFYGNKFFNGKEKTGKRPSFLQRYFTAKKA